MKIYNNMSIATVNDKIYLAHSCNNAIYEIPNVSGNFEVHNVVVGNTQRFGDNDNAVVFKGTNALLDKPRNIIKNSQNTELFFIDNDTLIKNVNIEAVSAQGGDDKQGFLESDIQPGYDIFKDIGYTYAKGARNTQLYFVDLHKIYFIDFTLESSEIVQESTNSLSAGSNFIGISYDNNTLYYAYTTSDSLHVKKRITHELYDFDIDHDCNINIDFSTQSALQTKSILNTVNNSIYGFVYIDNKIIISGSNIELNSYDLELYERNSDTDNFILNYTNYYNVNENLRIKTLTNYNAIFDDNLNKHILGRLESDGHYYIISIDNLIIGNEILLRDDFQIKNITPNPDKFIKDTDIIYTNKEYRTKDISILYKSTNSNINILTYNYSSFQTTKLNINSNFNYIQDIAIDNNDTLYIAERDSHTIYTIDLSTESPYTPTPYLENVSNIQTIHYTNNQLHYITNDSYHFVDIDKKNSDILSNITKTEPLDSLDLVTDLAIDKENNVGYIAFQERLKWFYPKIN